MRNCSSQSAMVPLRWAIDPLPPVLAGCCVLVALCLSCGTAEWKDNRHRTSDSKCVAARRGRYKYKVLFVSHRSPRPMGDGHTHSEQVKCKEKRLLKEMRQEWGKWPNGTTKKQQHTVHAACKGSQQQHTKKRKTGAKWGEKNSLTPSFMNDFVLGETYF